MVHQTDDLPFLRQYEAVTLRKPQIVADNVLTGIFLADTTHRSALAALLLQEAVEAARRFAAVWQALVDRTEPPARRLQRPLPGAAALADVAEILGMTEVPDEILARLGIDDSGTQSAVEVMAFGGLAWFVEAIRCAESGPPDVNVEPGSPPTLVWHGHDAAGAAREVRIELADPQVIALGDATGDLVTWARDFLGAYLDSRAAGVASG